MSEDQSNSPVSHCESHFRQLHEQCSGVLTTSLHGERIAQQANALTFVGDLQNWREQVRPLANTAPLQMAAQECEFSLIALLQGHYRHAFMGLRLCLELSLGCIHFSVHRIELREWIEGRFDVAWERIVDKDNGVLSKRFAAAFFPALSDDVVHYNTLARKVYRECSEYVHGNPSRAISLDAPLSFNEMIFEEFHQLSDAMSLIVVFSLAMAFLRDLDNGSREKLESSIIDRVGHVPAIRAVIGGTVEKEQ